MGHEQPFTLHSVRPRVTVESSLNQHPLSLSHLGFATVMNFSFPIINTLVYLRSINVSLALSTSLESTFGFIFFSARTTSGTSITRYMILLHVRICIPSTPNIRSLSTGTSNKNVEGFAVLRCVHSSRCICIEETNSKTIHQEDTLSVCVYVSICRSILSDVCAVRRLVIARGDGLNKPRICFVIGNPSKTLRERKADCDFLAFCLSVLPMAAVRLFLLQTDDSHAW